MAAEKKHKWVKLDNNKVAILQELDPCTHESLISKHGAVFVQVKKEPWVN